jgi:hypothetical protein
MLPVMTNIVQTQQNTKAMTSNLQLIGLLTIPSWSSVPARKIVGTASTGTRYCTSLRLQAQVMLYAFESIRTCRCGVTALATTCSN